MRNSKTTKGLEKFYKKQFTNLSGNLFLFDFIFLIFFYFDYMHQLIEIQYQQHQIADNQMKIMVTEENHNMLYMNNESNPFTSDSLEISSIPISDTSNSVSLNQFSDSWSSITTPSEPLTQYKMISSSDELQKKQEECKILLEENESLKLNINELNSELDRVNILLRNSKEMYDSKQIELNLALQENSQLKNQASHSVEQNEKFLQKLQDKYSAEISSLESKLLIAKETEKTLTQSVNNLNFELQEKNVKIKSSEEQNINLVQTNPDLQILLENLKKRENENDEKVNEIKETELEKTQKLIEKILYRQKMLDECKSEKKALENQIKNSNKTTANILLENQTINIERENMQLAMNELNAKLKELNGIKTNHDDLLAAFEKVKSKLNNESKKNEELISDFKAHIAKKDLEKTVIDKMHAKLIQTAKEKLAQYKKSL